MINAARTQAIAARCREPVSFATPQPMAITAAIALMNGARWIAASEYPRKWVTIP